MYNLLINTSDLSRHIEAHGKINATANQVSGVVGYIMQVEIGSEQKTLSTHLSDKPRLFKRSDALLKEASKLGIAAVTFSLSNE